MTTEKNGGPAFPHVVRQLGYGDERLTEGGMSLRDWFAGQALAGWLASLTPDDGDPNPSLTSRLVYALADAMLAEREK